jgi:iron-sulfur cluster assembly accessory protein
MQIGLITVTPAAREHILKMMMKLDGACFFHLSLKKTGCNGYMYMPKLVDHVSDVDEQVCIDEELTMLVPSATVDLLRGTQIDFQLKQWGMSQLTFIHPKAAGVCGCGESFNFSEDDKND